MSTNKGLVFYETIAIKNMVVVHIPVHYPGETAKGFDTCTDKQKLAVLKRAKYRMEEEIKKLNERILQDEIKASGQLSIE